METTSPPLERDNPSSTTTNLNPQIQTPPLTPKPAPRSEPPNPYPTTFVQADTSSFKQVVQMLTGSSKNPVPDPPTSAKGSIPPIKTGQKKTGFKLYERRNSIKNGLMINPSVPTRLPEMLSPSILDFPALALSPVTPLNEDPFNKGGNCCSSPAVEEDRAIKEKRFYLHPSTPAGGSAPELLPLFPVTSPRVSGSSS